MEIYIMINVILGITIFMLITTIVIFFADYRLLKSFILKEKDRNLSFTAKQAEDYEKNNTGHVTPEFVKKSLSSLAENEDLEDFDTEID